VAANVRFLNASVVEAQSPVPGGDFTVSAPSGLQQGFGQLAEIAVLVHVLDGGNGGEFRGEAERLVVGDRWRADPQGHALGANAISERQVRLVRDAGALAQLPLYLSALGISRAWMGDLAGAASSMVEAESTLAATGGVMFPWIALRLRGLRGNEAEAAATMALATEQAKPERTARRSAGSWNGLRRRPSHPATTPRSASKRAVERS
jgi:hypothetical protein